jgi:hypothetical protein
MTFVLYRRGAPHKREGHTDDDITNESDISSSGVKKCWQSIYTRVGLRLPELLPDDCYNGGGRGVEKKRRLLAYLRSHPEELRPRLALSSERAGSKVSSMTLLRDRRDSL